VKSITRPKEDLLTFRQKILMFVLQKLMQHIDEKVIIKNIHTFSEQT
jgi:hypothetical protein